MTAIGVVVLIIILGFLGVVAWCSLAINRPRTKGEEALRFKRDCEDFDKYMEEKRKKQ